ncbi:uncharacterized protein LOC115066968 [Nannospalax galili]|uniref:uncharacterized protein LOC115066968 n=1 Tax=Nannospalax galili TaxID=1026970 RepID=UPI00111C0AC1|nr:uncharacterized protein LOC115066968 [Nannospalax galili]
MSTFPLPMLVMYNAQVYPRFFVTNKNLGLAYLPRDEQIEELMENRTIPLKGSLCFLVEGNNFSSPCIILGNLSSAWLKEATVGGKAFNIVANATVLYGWWPRSPTTNKTSAPPIQPKLAPFCTGRQDKGLALPWTGCQSRDAMWALEGLFSFSPTIGRGSNFTVMDPDQANTNPFDQWLLCGVNGSCTDLSPLAMLKGGMGELGQLEYNWQGNFGKQLSSGKSSGSGRWTTTDIKYKTFAYENYATTPVCVWPPFIWIVSNKSHVEARLECGEGDCYYTLCWDAERFPIAIVTRMPRFVPVPVEAPNSMSLSRQRRDFGISAIVVAIIATTAVAASVTASALALSSSVQAAQSINDLSATVFLAIDKQTSANTQIQGGLMLVNQRIDLVQEQLDISWQMAQLGCVQKLPGLCITSIPYENFTRAANLFKSLSQYILQNWTSEFEQTLCELRTAVLQINSTRLDLPFNEGLSSWISLVVSYFKEWVGVGMFGMAICCGLVFLLWMVCRLRTQNKRDKVVIVHALAALEHGASTDVWLTMLKQ